MAADKNTEKAKGTTPPASESDAGSPVPENPGVQVVIKEDVSTSIAALTARVDALESKIEKAIAQSSPTAAPNPQSASTAVGQGTDAGGCRGSVCFVLCSKEEILGSLSGQINILGAKRCYEKKLHPHEREIRFTDLPDSAYEAYVSVGRDFAIQTKCRISSGDSKSDCVIGDDQKIPFKIQSACETRIELDLTYAGCDLVVSAEGISRTEKGHKEKISGVTINLIYKDKVVACCQTGTEGSAKFPLKQPGPHFVEAQNVVNLNDGKYKLVYPGRVMVLPNPGQKESMQLAIEYAKSGAEMQFGPSIRGASGSDQVQLALFRGSHNRFVKSQTWQSGSSFAWDDLEEDIYTLVVQESASLSLVSPPHGYQPVQLATGLRADFAEFIHFQSRKNIAAVNNITGQVTNADGPVAYTLIELLESATQRALMTSFTDENGNYSFYTLQNPGKLAIRIAGEILQLQSTVTTGSPGITVVAQEASTPEIVSPPETSAAYTNLVATLP